MKKKLIIAAAIAFAVFAIPYGSSALSTVSVASENNTVVTPTPAPSTKPVEEVKNAVDAIDTSKITDAASADNAAVALIKIGSQDLKEAMNAGQDTVNDVAAIEAAYKKAKGIKDTTLANSGAVKAVGIVGAAFVAPDTTLSVEAPAATPEITSSTYAVTSTPVYVEISLKAGPSSVKSLPIPVAVTIETPAGVDGNKAVIFHFVNGGLEEIKPIYNASANTLTFTVNHFSTFAIAEAKAVRGQWTQLINTEYTIPEDATNMQLYIETADSSNNFYVDEVIGAVAGTKVEGPEAVSLIIGDVNSDGIIDSFDMASARKGISGTFANSVSQLAADVDQNGTADDEDLVQLQDYILGRIDSFTVKEVTE